jgi:hypothetical protein
MNMAARLACFIAGLISVTCVFAQERMEAGVLLKLARDTGKPSKGILIGPAADYLHQTFQTQATIYAEASIVKKIDERCNRMKVVFRMPDFVITVRNPANRDEQKTGPFETTAEMNLCD